MFSEQEPLLGFAGLYEFWPDPELEEDDPNRWLLSCTVLTTTTQDALGHVHDRSPVIVPRDRFAEWLDPNLTDKADCPALAQVAARADVDATDSQPACEQCAPQRT
ncbi:SOS response-associated peptidase family protein [Paenarthrobacter sp. 2TAF44]|uniref:SOS response-associated peptidase family protein n=1 Tax=Paenarthrobacter sp. 2TAF44 TaxID=3233018 RepID=UPI003F9A17A5